jgi:hypothetical protein
MNLGLARFLAVLGLGLPRQNRFGQRPEAGLRGGDAAIAARSGAGTWPEPTPVPMLFPMPPPLPGPQAVRRVAGRRTRQIDLRTAMSGLAKMVGSTVRMARDSRITHGGKELLERPGREVADAGHGLGVIPSPPHRPPWDGDFVFQQVDA